MNNTPINKQQKVDILNEPAPQEEPGAERNFFSRFITGLVIMAVALGLNLILYFVLARIFKVNYLFSNAWAWLAYTVFLYGARKFYFYRGTAKGFMGNVREFYRFMGMRVGTGMLDMVFMFVLVSLAGVHPMNAKIVDLAVITIINAVLTNFWIFKPKSEPAPNQTEQNLPGGEKTI